VLNFIHLIKTASLTSNAIDMKELIEEIASVEMRQHQTFFKGTTGFSEKGR
jgi:hypothetical protein